ncbi:hypothetical protein Raf01_94820 [Rugosimonospora africana]|uniref:Thioesterase family protein n=2 Tax=Rugosimonospora africana TaxID=556532 RepID=A0A8J3VWH0_9ACTN|nr:hypothetical protein Raf01_94820 [Rugosimonospora africana]
MAGQQSPRAAAPTLTVPSRFRGPAGSANGGYVCGRIAEYLDGPVTVTLRRPPPLDTPMTVESDGGDGLRLRHGSTLVAEAAQAHNSPTLRVPDTASMAEARAAEGRAAYFQDPLYPDCFVCGTGRQPGDGLRVFAGPVPGRGLWAAPWTPDASLANGSRRLRPEIVWAVLDCPSGIAAAEAVDLSENTAILLGRMTVLLAEVPAVGERYRVIAWPIAHDDRKLTAGSALLGPGDGVLAVAETVWLTVPRPAAGVAAKGTR